MYASLQLGPNTLCYSAPNLSSDSMVITTGVKLDLLQDQLFREKSSGGINGLRALRQFEANNKYLENFNPNEEFTLGAF